MVLYFCKYYGMENENTISQKPLEDYLVMPGEQSPYANLLIDLAFKKAFDSDKPTSRENLINLLNDLLAPQLKRPIKNVWTHNVAKNLSGSKVSRTAIFDLHCVDGEAYCNNIGFGNRRANFRCL